MDALTTRILRLKRIVALALIGLAVLGLWVTEAYYSLMNEQPQIHSLDAPSTSRIVPLGRVDLVELGGIAFDRATFQPGWRWSEHQESIVEGQLCSQRHLGYLISGRMRFQMEDGTEVEAAAGDVYLIPPGHDAWVVGDQRCAALDLSFHDRGAGTPSWPAAHN